MKAGRKHGGYRMRKGSKQDGDRIDDRYRVVAGQRHEGGRVETG